MDSFSAPGGGDFAWSEDQRTAVIKHEFAHAKRGASAYSEREVDDFLDEVARAMGEGRPLPSFNRTFDSPGMLRRGYDAAQVDEYLRQLAQQVPGRSTANASAQAPVVPPVESGAVHRWSAAQRDSVRNAVFTKPKGFWTSGYDEIQVDALLEEVATAMERQQPLPDVTAAVFTKPQGFGRAGYDVDQVDDLLDRIARMVPEG